MKLVLRINKSISLNSDGIHFFNRYMDNGTKTALHFECYIIDNEIDKYYRFLCDPKDNQYILQTLDKKNMGDTISINDNIINMFIETIGRINILEDCLEGNKVALYMREHYL